MDGKETNGTTLRYVTLRVSSTKKFLKRFYFFHDEQVLFCDLCSSAFLSFSLSLSLEKSMVGDGCWKIFRPTYGDDLLFR